MGVIAAPDDIVGMSFYLLTLAMAGQAAFMFLQRRRVSTGWQTPVVVMGVVAFVSALSYLELGGLWAAKHAVPSVYRFADWLLTVPLLTVSFFLVLRAVAEPSAALFWRLLVASAVLVVAAYLGAADYISATLGFLVSLVAGLYVIGELYLGEAGRIAAGLPPGAQSAFTAIRLIATIGWAIYPLGYFMEHLGGGVDQGALNLIYNLADLLNKITFGLVVFQEAASAGTGSGRT